MIKVLSLLENKYHLLIIGKVSSRYFKKLKNLIEILKCEDRVKFKEMSQEKIIEHIKKAFLCFSYVPSIESYQDQFVLKNIEYLACERPVFSTFTRYNKGFQNIGASLSPKSVIETHF